MRKILLIWICMFVLLVSTALAVTDSYDGGSEDQSGQLDDNCYGMIVNFTESVRLDKVHYIHNSSTSNASNNGNGFICLQSDATSYESCNSNKLSKFNCNDLTFSCDLETNPVLSKSTEYFICMNTTGTSQAPIHNAVVPGGYPLTTGKTTWIGYQLIFLGGSGGQETTNRIYGFNGTTYNISGGTVLNLSTSPFPENTSFMQFNNNNVTLGLEVNSSIPYNCSLFINNTQNKTDTFVASNKEVNFTTNLVDGYYDYHFSCFNSTNFNNNNQNTTSKMILVDTANPTLATNFSTNGFFFRNITGEFNFTDTVIMHSYNISVSGKSIALNNDLNSSFYRYNLSSYIGNLTAGEHTLSVTFADGHTKNKLKDRDGWDWRNGLFDSYLEFDWGNKYKAGDVNIKGKGGSNSGTWSATEGTDRYNFVFMPDVPATTYTFEVQSSFDIKVIKNYNTDYKEWIIIDEHWLDFYLPNETGMTIDIVKKNNKKVEVTIANVNPQLYYEFNSVGDLNIVTQTFGFNTTNATLTYTKSVSELQSQTQTLRIETPTGVSSTEAGLTHNVTGFNVTKLSFGSYDLYTATYITPAISGTTGNVQLNWSFNITTTTNTITDNIIANQTIGKIIINNCSTLGQRAINFSLRKEEDNSLVAGSAKGYFQVWVENINNYVPFNLTWYGGTLSNNFSLCIIPNETTYQAYAQIEYSAPGFVEKTYFFTNVTLDNTTDNINLLLGNGTSLVAFNVLDENDDKLANVTIKILSYDLATDSYVVSEIIKTDGDGQAIGHITLNTQFYKFILEKDLKQIFESDPTKITSTSKTFRVNLGSDYFEDFTTAFNTLGNVFFTNSTLTFTFTFSDSTGSTQQGCLKVTRRSVNGDTVLNTTCTSSSAASLNIPINEGVGTNTYFAVGYILIDGQEFVLDQESVSFDNRYKTWGLEGIFMTFLIILTLAMVGVSSLNPAIAIGLMMFGLIGAVLMTIFFMSWPALVVFIIIGGMVLYRISR